MCSSDLQVENKSFAYVDGIELIDGYRVIFSKASDPLVRNTVYKVNFVSPEGQSVISLEPIETVVANNTVYSKLGNINGDRTFYYTGSNWLSGQQKTETNQAPLFDVIDSNGNSLGDRSLYPLASDTFAFYGTKIFGYKESSYTTDDSVLGFPISYRSINNIGDIEFFNYFDNQIIEYLENNTATQQKINLGCLQYNTSADTYVRKTVWRSEGTRLNSSH